MRLKTLTTINVFYPLIVGGFIYISFRSMSLRLFNWFEIVGIKSAALSIRNIIYPFKNELPTWTYFSLPDGLWIYSFTSALIIYWEGDFDNLKYWLLIPFFLGVIVEVLQGLKLFKGTFDVFDLLFSLSGFLLSIYILNKKIKYNGKKVY